MSEAPDPLEAHYTTVTNAMIEGDVVPFLGAGVNMCDRPLDAVWQRGRYLPKGNELAEYLAVQFGYQGHDKQDLLRVSQYATVMRGSGPLYRHLYSVFAVDYPPTSLHRFFATLPSILRQKRYPAYQVIVTTNYDDVLERAFQEAMEPYDLVYYIAEGEQRGQFWHCPHGGTRHLIDRPNEHTDLPIADMEVQRTVILKIHGAVDRTSIEQSSFVITEDHYIDYLTRTDVSSLLPVKLAAKLRSSNYLFLGYSLRDWNLRVILYRIWNKAMLTYRSWAVQLDPEALDQKFWGNYGVEIINQSLDKYMAALSDRIQGLPPPEVGHG